MQNLNLYTYNNQSLADIHRDYLKSKEVKVEEKKESFFTLRLLLSLVAGFLVISLGSGYLVYLLLKEPVAVLEPTSVGPDLRTTEEKLGYVSVQIFEFSDEVAVEPKKVIENIQEKPIAPKETQVARADVYNETKKTLEAVPISNKEVASAVAKAINSNQEKSNAKANEGGKKANTQSSIAVLANEPKRYHILFENIDQKQYDTISSKSKAFKLVPQVLDYNSTTKIAWQVYRVEPNGNVTIGDTKVAFVKSFDTKEDAVDFAKNNNIESVIRAEEVVNKKYTLKLCCSDLETSKKVAEASNITDIVIKIVREK